MWDGYAKLTMFSEGIRPALNTLYDIDDNNLESAQSYQTHMVSARMRSIAARIWLLTTYARVGERLGMKANSATILNLGVGNLWMMLGVTNVDDLRETAKFFTGTSRRVRTTTMNRMADTDPSAV